MIQSQSVTLTRGNSPNFLYADSTAVDPWYLLAEISMLQQDYIQAYDYFQQAVLRSPRSAQIWISIATLYYHINQFEEALEAIMRSIRLNPFIYQSWYNIGVLVGDIIHALHSTVFIEKKNSTICVIGLEVHTRALRNA